jgi:hypothetical protein
MSEEGLRREGMQWLSEDGIETADTWTFCVEAEQHWF